MEYQTITCYTKEEFRKWLQKHHEKESKVVVIVHKRHTGKPFPKHRELLDEAICFGWIDTIINRIDDHTFARTFVKRNEKGRWSDNTLSYAKQLLKDGRMAEQGVHFYKLGMKRPTHDHGIPKNPDMPEELKKALAVNSKAKQTFETYSPSTKRTLYRWILRGKQAETRQKRVANILARAIKGLRVTI